jgi:hypothetical protein
VSDEVDIFSHFVDILLVDYLDVGIGTHVVPNIEIQNLVSQLVSKWRTAFTQGCQMVYFRTKNPNLCILEGPRMENAGLFFGHLVYFWAIWYIFWPFGIIFVYLV